MSFDGFTVDGDKLNYWENDVMAEFKNAFGNFDGNKTRILELIDVCEAELAEPKSWLTELVAMTALRNLKGQLEDFLSNSLQKNQTHFETALL